MADKKPSSGDVLRALAEEVRSGSVHPDRASILDAFLDDDSDTSEQQSEPGPSEAPNEPKQPADPQKGKK